MHAMFPLKILSVLNIFVKLRLVSKVKHEVFPCRSQLRLHVVNSPRNMLQYSLHKIKLNEATEF